MLNFFLQKSLFSNKSYDKTNIIFLNISAGAKLILTSFIKRQTLSYRDINSLKLLGVYLNGTLHTTFHIQNTLVLLYLDQLTCPKFHGLGEILL